MGVGAGGMSEMQEVFPDERQKIVRLSLRMAGQQSRSQERRRAECCVRCAVSMVGREGDEVVCRVSWYQIHR